MHNLTGLTDGAGIAKAAFESVKKHFEDSNSLTSQDKALLQGSSSLQDVQKAVASAMAKYEAKAESSKTRKWLQRFSETICHYSKVLDVLVQHHPEYVALVWGTMKLLFIVGCHIACATLESNTSTIDRGKSRRDS